MERRLNDICLQLYEVGALKFGEFKMKVGVTSPVYFDLRIMIAYPNIMRELSDLLLEFSKIEKVDCDVVCGVPYTALPLATLIAVKAQLPMLIRRKEAKDYGTKKLIEGKFSKNDLCIIFEDVVTTGSSILDTVNDLKKEGLIVRDAFVVLDREQGGVKNLAKQGIAMHSLLTLSQVLKYLKAGGKIDDSKIEEIHKYIKENQMDPRGEPIKTVEVSRLQMTFGDRAALSQCAVTVRLLELMARKQSTLCVAADVTGAQQLVALADAVGPSVAVLKTHQDLVTDWTPATASELRRLAKRHDFLIMEDRKYADIGHTVGLQYAAVCEWADLVTVHGLAGDGALAAIAERVRTVEEPRGVVLVAQLSCEGALITPQYTNSVMRQAATYHRLVAGLVCQSADVVVSPGLVQMTPGVSAVAHADGLGQQYDSPQHVVSDRGADLAIVGRAIVNARDPAAVAEQYKRLLWDAYLERTKPSPAQPN